MGEGFWYWDGWKIVKWFIGLCVLAFVVMLILSYFDVIKFKF